MSYSEAAAQEYIASFPGSRMKQKAKIAKEEGSEQFKAKVVEFLRAKNPLPSNEAGGADEPTQTQSQTQTQTTAQKQSASDEAKAAEEAAKLEAKMANREASRRKRVEKNVTVDKNAKKREAEVRRIAGEQPIEAPSQKKLGKRPASANPASEQVPAAAVDADVGSTILSPCDLATFRIRLQNACNNTCS